MKKATKILSLLKTRYIIIGIGIYLGVLYFIPVALAGPIATVIGLVAMIIGLVKVPKENRRAAQWCQSHGDSYNRMKVAIPALSFAGLSLFLWVPLFTFTVYIFWSTLAMGPTVIWTVVSGIYGYLILSESMYSD